MKFRTRHPRMLRPRVLAATLGGDGASRALVADHVRGKTLEDTMRDRGRLRPEDTAPVLAAVARVLSHLHERGWVARDRLAIEGGSAGGLLVGAAVFGVVALFVLVDALVKWLATMVHSEALAALIVGGVLLVVAVALALIGRNAMSLSTLAPVRTTRQVREDARTLSERVSG